MSSEEMGKFLRDGLARYAAAKEAVLLFEEKIKNELERFLKSMEWNHFVPSRPGGQTDIRLLSGTHPVHGTWINAIQYGADKGGVNVELGLWWGTRLAPDGAALYASRRTREPLDVPLKDPVPPVRCEALGKIRSLVIVVGPEFDLERDALILLKELDRAMGEMKEPTRR